jgi:hypothetical protein
VNFCAIGTNEKGGKAKVETCAFTRHGSVDRPFSDVETEVSEQVACGLTLDCYGLDLAVNRSGQGQLVVTFANAEPVAIELPARLRQGERLGFGDLAVGRRAFVLSTKELLIALLDAENEVLNGLRTELLPVCVLGLLLESGDMFFEGVEIQRVSVLLVVRLAKPDAVVVDFTTNIDLPVESPVPFVAVNLVDIRCTHGRENDIMWYESRT